MIHDTTIWQRAKGIVGEAIEWPASERAALVERRCGGDHELLREVTSLLEAAGSSEAVLHPQTDGWVGAARVPLSLPVTGQIGGFELLRVLADGPGAAVYLAHQYQPDRQVALKLLRSFPLLGPDPRYWVEAAAAARVEHPNVVRMYEAGMVEVTPGTRIPYIAMEYVDGVPITEYTRACDLNVREIVQLLTDMGAGVVRIHQCGILHRDLKPSNVLVDAEGVPHVLDFGIARLVSGQDHGWHTSDGSMMGTPGYISPEQIEHPAAVDVRTDVWAMGVLAYESLTGENPFVSSGGSLFDLMHRVVSEDPPPLRRRVPGLDADIEAVVLKAMARRMSDRYDSVTDFIEDLNRAIAHRPVHARRSTWLYRTVKFVQRHAVVLTGIMLATAMILALLFMQSRAWREAARQRDYAAAAFDVMRGMISSADPNFGHRNVLMRDVLHGMMQSLDVRAGRDSETEAEVRSLLGGLCFSLGEYEQSYDQLQLAIALRERNGASESARALLDRAALAQTLRWLYRPEEALVIAEQAMRIAQVRFGDTHETTLAAREAIAGCWHDLHRYADAEEAYRQIIRERSGISATDRATLTARGNLATLLSDMARYDESEAILRELVQQWNMHVGSLEAITVSANLARVVAEQGRLDEAVALLQRLEGDAVDALGAEHPATITMCINRIEFLQRQGQQAESIQLAAQLVDRCSASLGWSHDLTLTALTGYVTSLVRAERSDEAIALVHTARLACQRTLSPESAWWPRLDSLLAAALGSAGLHDECVALYEDSIARLEASFGEQHRQTLIGRNNLAVALIDAGRSHEAVALLERVLASCREAGYQEMEPVVERNHGRALIASGEIERGIAALESAFALSISRQERNNALTCAQLLADHYTTAGDHARASAWTASAQSAMQN